MMGTVVGVIFGSLSLVYLIRYALGKKMTAKFKGGEIVKMSIDGKALTRITDREVIQARKIYAEVVAHPITTGSDVPARNENAIVVALRELNTRLGLGQKIKTAEEWAKFYRAVSDRAQSLDQAVEMFYRVFGGFPPEASAAMRERIQLKVDGERSRNDSAQRFDDERTDHQRRAERDRWGREIPLQRIEDEVRFENAKAERAAAERRRLQEEKEIESLKSPKPTQNSPKPTSQPKSTFDRRMEVHDKYDRRKSEIERRKMTDEERTREIEALDDWKRTELNRLHE